MYFSSYTWFYASNGCTSLMWMFDSTWGLYIYTFLPGYQRFVPTVHLRWILMVSKSAFMNVGTRMVVKVLVFENNCIFIRRFTDAFGAIWLECNYDSEQYIICIYLEISQLRLNKISYIIYKSNKIYSHQGFKSQFEKRIKDIYQQYTRVQFRLSMRFFMNFATLIVIKYWVFQNK